MLPTLPGPCSVMQGQRGRTAPWLQTRALGHIWISESFVGKCTTKPNQGTTAIKWVVNVGSQLFFQHNSRNTIIMIIVSNICFSCVSDTILSALKILTHFYVKAILPLSLLVYRKGNRGTERLSGMPHAGIWATAVRVQGPHLLTTTMLLLLWRKRQWRTFLRHSYKILRQTALPPAKTSTVR